MRGDRGAELSQTIHGTCAGSTCATREGTRNYNDLIIRLIIWILYFLLPSQGGIIDGLPAGRIETIGLLLVAWIALHRVRLTGAWPAGAVAVAAALASLAIPGDVGLHARYYATAAASGEPERSIEFRRSEYTRVDRRLDFARGAHDFPLGFFNDHTRFNFIHAGEPERRYLEFAVAWIGWWHVRAGTHTLYLDAPHASAQVFVDASAVLTTDAASSAQTRSLELTEGWHRLHVTFSSPYGSPRVFSAGEMRDGARQPFDEDVVRTERIDGRQALVARTLAIVKTAADLIALAWLGVLAGLIVLRRIGEVWQRRIPIFPAVTALFLAAGAVEALRFAWQWAERFLVMAGGDDPMTYEGYARDILLNGILMNGGRPHGTGEPFYYQAFYPYFLAATHFVFGEGFFGALLLQRFFVAVTAVLLTRIAMKLRGDGVWPVALTAAALFTWWKFAPIAADMLNESLYIPLLAAWTLALIETCRRPSTRRGAITGLFGGLAAITRTTAMLSWVLVWPATFRHLKNRGDRMPTIAALVMCSLAVLSLISMRNAIVSHTFSPTPTELGVTLRGGNEPPADLVLNPAPRQRFYDRFGLSGYTVDVIEYARTAPGAFAANMARKAVFALGFYEPYAEGWGYSPVYIATTVGAVAGLVVLLRSFGPSAPLLIPLLIALTQYAAVVIVYPKGERLILPIHTLLLPYAAIAAYEIYARLVGTTR